MGKLNRTPEGFLDLTGQQTGGRYPTEIADTVAPTMDLFPIVGSRLISTETAPLLTSAVDDVATIEVPENENWLLFQVSYIVIGGIAADKVRIAVRLTQLPGSSNPLNLLYLINSHDDIATGLAASHYFGQAKSFAQPIALSPGCQIQALVTDTNNNALGWALNVGFYRLTGN